MIQITPVTPQKEGCKVVEWRVVFLEFRLTQYHSPLMKPFLKTKTSVPGCRSEIIRRPRLLDRLEVGKSVKLTFVCAPAGFGKTTLLSEWTGCDRNTGYPVAWLSLDESDQDPNRFWGYVIQALGRLSITIRESTLSLLLSPYDLQVDTFLVTFINEIADVQKDFTLVLDDYHLIESEIIHASMGYFLNHLPKNMHVIIATRAEVPLPIARLRARGQMVEIRAGDLRFNLDESHQFLDEVMHLKITREDTALIDRRIEGWIVGLQMAGLSLQDREDLPRVIGSLGEGNRFIFDYLAEEVLNHQSERIQTFLLKTAILNELSGPLCSHLTGMEDAGEILHTLEHANLFLSPINPKNTWYRYHRLFASYLQECLSQRMPESIPHLHRLAAEWYAGNNNPRDAINHALAARDYSLAVDLMDQVAEKTYELGQWSTIIRWIQQAPDDHLFHHPKLCSVYAAVLAPSGHLDEAERVLNEAQKRLSDPGNSEAGAGHGDNTLYGEMMGVRSTIARMRENFETAIQLARQAIPLLPRYHYPWFNAMMNSGHAYRLNGQMEEAARMYHQAIEAAQENKIDLSVLISGTSYLAATCAIQGKLHQAVEIYHKALDIAQHYNIPAHPSLGIVNVGLAELYREWDDNQAASRYLQEGLKMAMQEWGEGVVRAGYINNERILRVFGDLDGALDKIRDAQYLLPGPPLPRALARIKACQAWLSLNHGDLEMARLWAQGCNLNPKASPRYVEELEYVVLARVRLAEGDAESARRIVSHLLEVARASDRLRNFIELLILYASTCVALGEEETAYQSLLESIALAQEEGYIRSFVDESHYLLPLIARLTHDTHFLQERRINEEYITRLLDGMQKSSGSNSAEGRSTGQTPVSHHQGVGLIHDGWEMTESLQPREIEILQRIAAGLSNQEIADEIIIGVNTVRWYVQNIYSKLSVHSRTQAVARARQLNLL